MLCMCVPISCSLAIIPQQWNLDAVQRACWDSMNYEHGGYEAFQLTFQTKASNPFVSFALIILLLPLSFPVLLRYSLYLLLHLLYFILYNNLDYFRRHFCYCVCAAQSFEEETRLPTSDRKQLLRRRTSQVQENTRVRA